MAHLLAYIGSHEESLPTLSNISSNLSLPLASIPFNPKFSIKLDDANLIWIEQIKHKTIMYWFQGFFEGTEAILAWHIKQLVKSETDDMSNLEEILVDNPDYAVWDRKDKTTMSWIYNPISLRKLRLLYGNSSSHGYWTTLPQNVQDNNNSNLIELWWRL